MLERSTCARRQCIQQGRRERIRTERFEHHAKRESHHEWRNVWHLLEGSAQSHKNVVRLTFGAEVFAGMAAADQLLQKFDGDRLNSLVSSFDDHEDEVAIREIGFATPDVVTKVAEETNLAKKQVGGHT